MTNKAKKSPNAEIGPNAEALGPEKAREASIYVAETNEEVAAISGQVSTALKFFFRKLIGNKVLRALAPKLSNEPIEELNSFSLSKDSIKKIEEICAGDEERFKLVVELGIAAGEDASKAIDALIAAKEIYGDNEERFKLVVELVKEGEIGRASCRERV